MVNNGIVYRLVKFNSMASIRGAKGKDHIRKTVEWTMFCFLCRVDGRVRRMTGGPITFAAL